MLKTIAAIALAAAAPSTAVPNYDNDSFDAIESVSAIAPICLEGPSAIADLPRAERDHITEICVAFELGIVVATQPAAAPASGEEPAEPLARDIA